MDYPKLFYYRIDVAKIATITVIVKAVADDEVIGDVQGHILHGNASLVAFGLQEQGADMNLGRTHRLQALNKFVDGLARLDDVLYDYHAAAFDIFRHTDEFFYDTRRTRALIGLHLDERDLGRNVNMTEQVGSEDETAVEYA